MIGLEGKARFHAFDHGLGGIDFLGDARRCRLDIEDDGVFHIDQII